MFTVIVWEKKSVTTLTNYLEEPSKYLPLYIIFIKFAMIADIKFPITFH